MKRHDIDVVSLTVGSVFLGIVALWLLARLVTVALPPFGWFVAGALILAGALGVAATARQSQR